MTGELGDGAAGAMNAGRATGNAISVSGGDSVHSAGVVRKEVLTSALRALKVWDRLILGYGDSQGYNSLMFREEV
jgi:hypothetical protein